MGIMGALAGLGRGMQDYAATMEKQREMSWQAQMEQVRFERQKNLENLRASNNRDLQQDRLDAASAAAQEQRRFQLEDREYDRAEAERLQDRGIKKAGIEFDRQLEAKKAMLKEELKQRGAAALKSKKDQYEWTEGLSTKKRKEQFEEVTKSAYWSGLSEKKKEEIEFAMMHPEAAAAIAALNKRKEFPVKEYTSAYNRGSELWDAADKNEKASVIKKAAAYGIVDPEDVRDFFASSYARNATGLDAAIEKVAASKTEGGGRLKQSALQNFLQNPETITEDILSKVTDEGQKAKLIAAKKGTTKPAESAPKAGALAGPFDHAVIGPQPIRIGHGFDDRIRNIFTLREDPRPISEAQRRSADIYK